MSTVNLNSNISIAMQNLANDLEGKDEDKIITKEEVSKYIASIKNDEEFISLNISPAQAENELKSLLNVKDDSKEADTSTSTKSATETNSKDKSSLTEDYNAIKEKISELEDLIGGYDEQLNTLNATLEDLQAQLEKEQKKYDELVEQTKKEEDKYTKTEDKIESKNKEYSSLVGDIESASDKLAGDLESKQNSLVEEAKSKYDSQKDGSWENFVKKYISNNSTSSSYQGQLNSLVGESKSLSSSMDSLSTSLNKSASNINLLSSKVSSQANKVTTLNDEINTTTSSINNITSLKNEAQVELEDKKTELSNYVLNLVSEEEYALVEANNINLQEQMEDGSPRYVIAKGKEDGAYHIYDLQNGGSLARQYGCEGDGLRGTNIVPMGNGYMQGYKSLGADSDQGEEVFYFGCDGTLKNDKACYTTCSPLSFDINGDGVKTSNKVIDYDIDGDGIKDKINDSADAVLVFDKDGDGISGEDGSECFGNNTDLDGDGKADGYKDGFEALKALAKKEGLINGKDDNKLDENDLKVLEEKYGLKIKTDGYNSDAKSLNDVGITEIDLSQTDGTEMLDNFDGNGNQLMKQNGATFKINGETREYADIWHKKLTNEDIEEQKTNSSLASNSSLSNFKLDRDVLNFKMNNRIFSEIKTSKSKGKNTINKINSAKLDELADIDSSFKGRKTKEEKIEENQTEEMKKAQEEEMEKEMEKEKEKEKKKLNPFG